MNTVLFHRDVAEAYPDYLRDESRLFGRAETISFARSEDDIRKVMAAGKPVTTQGSRTGITGGAVPDGGDILNLSRMTRITGMRYNSGRDEFFLTVQPGLLLAELRKCLQTCELDVSGWTAESLSAWEQYGRSPNYFFPPDPTETSASIGGMVACNASGACTFQYGATRCYVEALRMVLPSGETVVVRRGRDKATGRSFSIQTEEGRWIHGSLPDYTLPGVKNAAGFFSADNMDLVDLFVGSEGTLAVFSEIEIRLIRQPACRWGVVAFFPSNESAVQFVKVVRGLPSGQRPVAVEYFDSHALELLRRQKATNPAFPGLPELSAAYHTAIYVEYHGEEGQVSEAVGGLPSCMEAVGGSGEDSWIADTGRELERMKTFRHAVPEAVNLIIDEWRKKEPELTKLGTDMAVTNIELCSILETYRTGLVAAKLDYVIFGHIGDNHVHVNILPRSIQDYNRGKDLYLQWARRVVSVGGTVSAEHGIGKFKVALLREMLGDRGIGQMRRLKRVFDPDGRLNRGNLF